MDTAAPTPVLDYRSPQPHLSPLARGVALTGATLILAVGVLIVITFVLTTLGVDRNDATTLGIGTGIAFCGSVVLLAVVIRTLPLAATNAAFLTQKVTVNVLAAIFLYGALTLINTTVVAHSARTAVLPFMSAVGFLLASLWFAVIGIYVRPSTP